MALPDYYRNTLDTIANWNIGVDQRNPDRGAYRDAFMMSTAEKGVNYDLASRLMDQSVNNEMNLTRQAADLDRRNTLDLMSAEHGFNLQGMKTSQALAKDYAYAQGNIQSNLIKTEGEQARLNIRETTAGQIATIGATGTQERLGMKTAGEEQRKGIVTTGEQERLNIGARGEQDRSTITRQAEEGRRSVEHEREHAASLATRMTRWR